MKELQELSDFSVFTKVVELQELSDFSVFTKAVELQELPPFSLLGDRHSKGGWVTYREGVTN